MRKHPNRGVFARTPNQRVRAGHPRRMSYLACAITATMTAIAEDANANPTLPPTGNLIVDGSSQTGTPGFHYITQLDGSDDPASTGYGLFVLNGGRLISSNIAVTTQGRGAHAAVAHAESSIVLGGTGVIRTSGDGSAGLQAVGTDAIILSPGYQVETQGRQAHGVIATGGGQVNFDLGSIRTSGDDSHGVGAVHGTTNVVASTINTYGSRSHGAKSSTGGLINISSSTITTAGAEAWGAWSSDGHVQMSSSHVETQGQRSHGLSSTGALGTVHAIQSTITTTGDGAAAIHLSGDGFMQANQSSMRADGFAALVVEGHGRWHLLDNSHAQGDGRLALISGDASSAEIKLDRSTGDGDIVRSTGNARNVDVSLTDSSRWSGSTDIVRGITVASGSAWHVGRSSSIGQLTLSEGFIFLPGHVGNPVGHVRVEGDMVGSGGVVAMQTRLDEGGAIARQLTDRLLVEGNVLTTGATSLQVRPIGSGALTDTNRNGIVEAHEGISLVQVGGASRADAFALVGGYVAAGPWQYQLHAFGPGATDSGQSQLQGNVLGWDYRLANAYVCVVACDGGEGPGPEVPGPEGPGPEVPEIPGKPGLPVDPEVPDRPGRPGGGIIPEGGGRPIIPDGSRPAVVPQVPSYLVAHTALLAYGQGSIDGLHDRLGEIRDNPADTRGEVFARQSGSRLHHASDISPMDFGFGFRQSTQMLQVGGSIVSLTDETDSLRAGWALDRGTTTITPRAPDGGSQTRYSANGFAAWITWQHHGGWYADAVVGAQRYRGAVDTDLRGRDVARLRANGRLLSIETGYPFSLGAHWSLEPQLQVAWQTLGFQPIRDKDNVVAAPGDSQQLTTRLGARLRRTTDGRWMPYARADVVGSTGGRGHVVFGTPGDDLTLAGGRTGRQLRMGAGLVANLRSNVQLYGEGTWRTAIGNHGFRGWAGNLGVRMSF